MELIKNIVIDLTKDGLAMIFRDYQVLMLKYLWRDTGLEASTRKLWTEVNKDLEPKGVNRPGASRASIINTGRRFAEEGLWDFHEVAAKGGHHRVYRAIMSEEDLWKAVRKLVTKKLDEAF
jgi:hypothetical protein